MLTVFVSSFKIANLYLKSENTLIIGVWISETDSKSKWVFTDDFKCKRYYDNILLNTYTYSISNISCNNQTDSEFNYLRLEKENATTVYCYAINGITSDPDGTYLSIEFNGNPRPILLKKI